MQIIVRKFGNSKPLVTDGFFAIERIYKTSNIIELKKDIN